MAKDCGTAAIHTLFETSGLLLGYCFQSHRHDVVPVSLRLVLPGNDVSAFQIYAGQSELGGQLSTLPRALRWMDLPLCGVSFFFLFVCFFFPTSNILLRLLEGRKLF